jgi:hypothetical protein
VKSRHPEQKTGEKRALKSKCPGDNKEEETNELQHRERPTAENQSIRDAPAASPLRFYARLRHELELRGIDYDRLPKLTPEGESPPCFESVGTPFEAWLASASLLGATVPYRFDMPAEPNYCHDCTAAHKQKAQAVGVCLFPNTRFERVQTVVRDDEGKNIEVEIVGISRSKTVAIDLEAEYDPEQEE